MMRIFGHYVPSSMLWLGLTEFCILFSAFVTGYVLRYSDLGQILDGTFPHYSQAFLYAGSMLLAMLALGLYEREAIIEPRTVIVRLVASLLLGFAILASIVFVSRATDVWRSGVVIACLLSVAGILASRWVFLMLANLRPFLKRVMVIGAGPRAELIERHAGRPSNGALQIVGYLRTGDAENSIAAAISQSQVPSITAFCLAHEVEEIIVAMEERRGRLPMEDLLNSRMHGIRVVDEVQFWERETGRVDIARLTPGWLVFGDGFAKSQWQRSQKRLLDIAASLFVLCLTAPIMLLSALAIKLEDGGPILYVQERVGLDGRAFRLFKFRSMSINAESDGRARWASDRDPRVTRVGRVTRRTRIDELPQLFNILRGDMSFIGPRPERPSFVHDLAQQIPYYAERHRVKPGLAGWAQLNYPYGASSDDAARKLEYDLYYIKNCSLFLDFLIMIQTLRVVVWGQGAR